ncbi:glycosyltransferase 87 family protein [Streptomyces sp. NPDC051976]|uniref:glycosyltransferase 87 family protein n=1 Tax=Streptomyces sp. NPDC051976 TaxID=3154947 RepID=UPI0034410D31
MSHRQRVGWAAVLCALSFAAVWLVQRAVHGSLVDVMVYRAAGRTVRDSGDLYAMRVTPAMLPMTYPPVAGLLFVPLTWLDVDRMRAAAIAGNLLLSVALAALSLRLVLRRTPSAAAVLATAAWAVWSEPVWATIRCGQINLLVVCPVLWDFTRRPANRWAGAGTGLAAALKVTPLLFLVLLAGAAVVTRGRGTPWPRRFLTAAGTFAGATLLAAVALPRDSLRYWTRCVFAPDRSGSAVNLANQSLRGVVARLQHTAHPTSLWLAAAVLIALGGTALAVMALASADRVPGATAWAAVTCGTTTLLASPITWTHHWVWNVPMTVLLVHEALRRRDPRWAAGAAACVVVFCCDALWAVPHDATRPEVHENAAQMLLAASYPLAGLAFLAAAALTLRPTRPSRCEPAPRTPDGRVQPTGRQAVRTGEPPRRSPGL